jgi:hypothetical protein
MKFILGLVMVAFVEFLITLKSRIDSVNNGVAPVEDVVVSVFDLVTCVVANMPTDWCFDRRLASPAEEHLLYQPIEGEHSREDNSHVLR